MCHCREDEPCHADEIISNYVDLYGTKPMTIIYAGQGSNEFRMKRTDWASPFRAGPHGTQDECVAKYMRWFETQHELENRLAELEGDVPLHVNVKQDKRAMLTFSQ